VETIAKKYEQSSAVGRKTGYGLDGPGIESTSASGTVGAIPIRDVPTKPAKGPDVTRPNGLPETIQMEDVSVAEQA